MLLLPPAARRRRRRCGCGQPDMSVSAATVVALLLIRNFLWTNGWMERYVVVFGWFVVTAVSS